MVVSRRLPLTAVVVLASFAAAGCKKSGTPATGPDGTPPGDARAAGAAGSQRPPATPAGMKAPFERRTATLAKTFAAAVKAYRTGKYGVAEQLFHAVVVARPDDTAARYQELRAAVRADPDADPRERLRALLLRDFVAYDHRLRTGAEFAPLWASPRANELEAIRAAARDAYADGLGRGAIFVGRNRNARPVMYDGKAKPVLELYQEAYAFDPGSGLVRRLSETAGRVAGIRIDRAGKLLVALIANGLMPDEVGTGMTFSAAAGMTLSLETLETVGPIALPIEAPASKIVLCTTAKGEARWTVGEARYAIDATKRRAVAVREDDCAPGTTVAVTPERGSFRRSVDSSVDAGVVNLSVDGGSRPIRLSELAQNDSVGWSPGRSRLAYAPPLEPCGLDYSGWPRTGMNSLYVWDPVAGKTVRLATAFSFFEFEWLDDDRLVYEGGGPKSAGGGPKSAGGGPKSAGGGPKGGKIVVHDFRAQTDAALEVPSGAGLSAVPSFECIARTVEDGGDEDDGAE